MTIDTAMIFAAGFGTRMGRMTAKMPKPMLPLGGRPMVDRTIELLHAAGITRLFANTHYLPDVIEPHLQSHGVITVREDPILETGGGLKAALQLIDRQRVITMNPDAFWQGPNPVAALLRSWRPEMTGLLMLTRREDGTVSDFSLEHGQISRKGPHRYSGLQILQTDLLHEIDHRAFSLNVYWDHLLGTHSLNGVVYEGHWSDIGTPEGLDEANRQLEK